MTMTRPWRGIEMTAAKVKKRLVLKKKEQFLLPVGYQDNFQQMLYRCIKGASRGTISGPPGVAFDFSSIDGIAP